MAPALSSRDVEYDPTLAVLTATLVAVVWYTYFTHEAVAQTREALGAEGERTRRRLHTLAARLLQAANDLPTGRPELSQMLHKGTWETVDLSELERLASWHGPEASTEARTASLTLSWVAEKVAGEKAIPGVVGADWSRFPHDAWREKLLAGREALEAIVALTQDEASR